MHSLIYKNAQSNSSNGALDGHDAFEVDLIKHSKVHVRVSPKELYALEGNEKNAFNVALNGALEGTFASAVDGTPEGTSKGAPKSAL